MSKPDDQNAPTPGSDEYNQMMAARFRDAGGDATGVETGGQPQDTSPATQEVASNVPDKFKNADGSVNVEALANSYRELERQRSSQTQAQAQAAETPSIPKETATAEQNADNAAAEAVEKANLSMDELTQAVQSGNGLTEGHYEALAKSGISKEMVDDYLSLRQDRAERTKNEVMEYGGGEEAVNGLLNWAAQNLSPAEIDGYNNLLAGPSWKTAIDALRTAQGASKPTANEPTLRSATSASTSSATGFTSRDEMKAAMADPRYFGHGPEADLYRQEVTQKMANAAWRKG